MQAVYKSLQADYTRKRQSESARVRELESKLAEKGAATTAQTPATPNEPGNQDFLGKLGLTEEKLAKMSLPEYTAYVLEAAKQGVQIETEAKAVETFESQAVSDFVTTDPRLNPEITSAFEPRMASWVASEMDKAYAKHIEETGSPLGFDYRTPAAEFVRQWDEWMENQVKNKVAKTTELAKTNAQKHLKSAPPTTTAKSTTGKSASLDDAISESIDEQS